MTPEEIKEECELQYNQIKNAEARLKELRSLCKHENTFEGNYSYRVGVVERALICSYCNTPILFPDRYLPQKDYLKTGKFPYPNNKPKR